MPSRSRQVDRLVDRVKRVVREIERFIVAVEEPMKRERHPEHRADGKVHAATAFAN